ncbi:MAG TPA: hypothetical protein VFZ69_11220, partial [Longimicrobiales bacterium]
HCAAWQGSAACMTALLRHPHAARLIEVRDATHGATPLGWCCHGAEHCGRAHADHPAVARLLLEAGARPPDGWANAPERVRAVIASHGR